MINYKIGNYIPSDSMCELICDNYPMLLVMSRFGIDLGFGDGSIEEVCSQNNVDTYTFLTVANLLIIKDKESVEIDLSKISLSVLVKYLHNSHAYFLEYRLPLIRQELIRALDKTNEVSTLILNYYDEYVSEVHKHMMYEEDTLFPYIVAVINGTSTNHYSIELFSKHHDKVEAKLSELKNIIIKYYHTKSTNDINNVLYNIFSCERDLASHNNIEDYLLVPTMKEVETQK